MKVATWKRIPQTPPLGESGDCGGWGSASESEEQSCEGWNETRRCSSRQKMRQRGKGECKYTWKTTRTRPVIKVTGKQKGCATPRVGAGRKSKRPKKATEEAMRRLEGCSSLVQSEGGANESPREAVACTDWVGFFLTQGLRRLPGASPHCNPTTHQVASPPRPAPAKRLGTSSCRSQPASAAVALPIQQCLKNLSLSNSSGRQGKPQSPNRESASRSKEVAPDTETTVNICECSKTRVSNCDGNVLKCGWPLTREQELNLIGNYKVFMEKRKLNAAHNRHSTYHTNPDQLRSARSTAQHKKFDFPTLAQSLLSGQKAAQALKKSTTQNICQGPIAARTSHDKLPRTLNTPSLSTHVPSATVPLQSAARISGLLGAPQTSTRQKREYLNKTWILAWNQEGNKTAQRLRVVARRRVERGSGVGGRNWGILKPFVRPARHRASVESGEAAPGRSGRLQRAPDSPVGSSSNTPNTRTVSWSGAAQRIRIATPMTQVPRFKSAGGDEASDRARGYASLAIKSSTSRSHATAKDGGRPIGGSDAKEEHAQSLASENMDVGGVHPRQWIVGQRCCGTVDDRSGSQTSRHAAIARLAQNWRRDEGWERSGEGSVPREEGGARSRGGEGRRAAKRGSRDRGLASKSRCPMSDHESVNLPQSVLDKSVGKPDATAKCVPPRSEEKQARRRKRLRRRYRVHPSSRAGKPDFEVIFKDMGKSTSSILGKAVKLCHHGLNHVRNLDPGMLLMWKLN
ncbi:hypothetical protein DFJ73DRAFT_763066 [Zopfochytrium polystomum]|nr:hypothetical protein DFJ73DRAFT_763066 [Zopfochytrium polystomum]